MILLQNKTSSNCRCFLLGMFWSVEETGNVFVLFPIDSFSAVKDFNRNSKMSPTRV